jgi:GNAT superfamily N-acetyltransferase
MKLRVARPDDAAAIGDVLRASYGSLYRGWYRDDVLDAALPAMTRANPRLITSGRYFVVEIAGRIISCGGWSFENPLGPTTPKTGHLRHFATHPDYLSRGAAGAILKRAVNEADGKGLAAMEVLSSLTAEAFYASHGFSQVAVVNAPMGPARFACMLMRRGIR